MSVDHRRIQNQNTYTYTKGPILYWMNRDMRIQDNWALLRAQELAIKYDTELLIYYNLDPEFLGGTIRQLDFKIGALRELHKDAVSKNIAFFTLVSSDIDILITSIKKHTIGYIVTDFAPLKIQQEWLKNLNSQINIPLEVVDTHNIVPLWEASDKKEFAAYTIRGKINKKLKDFLTDFPKLIKQKESTFQGGIIIPSNSNIQDLEYFDTILKKTKINRTVLPVTWCKPGEKNAHRMLQNFMTDHIHEYGEKRNDPVSDVQSQISPYLHYGMIAPQRVAYTINNALDIPQKSKEDFLEELIIRRELADNFCFYEKEYDNPKGFHDFFTQEHERIKGVKREYVYTLEEFEHAQTHDELWNACQMQMIQTGKMHGYLRMYWAKMIFAWSKNVSEAMNIAVYLNDTYELDGRDPNGYAGIAWCIGGVHDRPWFITNPVFGKLRYMSRGGMDKKFDTKAYIEKWTHAKLF